MGLNIKNERVHALAREAARLTGKTQTGAIEEALERLLRDVGADPEQSRIDRKVDLVQGIAVAYAADPGVADRAITRVEDLYDESTGLPR
jgi:antitoxin VapB